MWQGISNNIIPLNGEFALLLCNSGTVNLPEGWDLRPVSTGREPDLKLVPVLASKLSDPRKANSLLKVLLSRWPMTHLQHLKRIRKISSGDGTGVHPQGSAGFELHILLTDMMTSGMHAGGQDDKGTGLVDTVNEEGCPSLAVASASSDDGGQALSDRAAGAALAGDSVGVLSVVTDTGTASSPDCWPLQLAPIVEEYGLSPYIAQVPLYPADTREKWVEWTLVWPMTFHNNHGKKVSAIGSTFNHQESEAIYHCVLTLLDTAREGMRRSCERHKWGTRGPRAHGSGAWAVNAALIVDPATGTEMGRGWDETAGCPGLRGGDGSPRADASSSDLVDVDGAAGVAHGRQKPEYAGAPHMSPVPPHEPHALRHAAMVAIERAAQRDMRLFPRRDAVALSKGGHTGLPADGDAANTQAVLPGPCVATDEGPAVGGQARGSGDGWSRRLSEAGASVGCGGDSVALGCLEGNGAAFQVEETLPCHKRQKTLCSDEEKAANGAAIGGSAARPGGEDMAMVARCQAAQAPDPACAPYLCTGCDVFLLREPCTMCAMALVHQRLARVFFLLHNPHGGALASTYRLHGLRSLNHNYQVFQPGDWLYYDITLLVYKQSSFKEFDTRKDRPV
eukprot:jgi/Mesvir1/15896/Mv02799-RA.1